MEDVEVKQGTEIKLEKIAHARSGDKGEHANVALFARDAAHYDHLCCEVTASKVETFFKPLGVGEVVRYEVPNLGAIQFVLPHILGVGGSRSLRIDAQGKTLGQALLQMTIPSP